MKKTLLLLAAVLLTGLILKGSGVIDAIIMFIIIGALPGTSLSLSPSMTMAIITTLVAMAIIVLSTNLNIQNTSPNPESKKPLRRYSKI